MAKEIAEEYTSSLADLTLNSKPLINMLTMLADDNIEHAEVIVEAVEKHLDKVRSEFKLPVLYLIDSIVKNVGRAYTTMFTQNIVNTFCSVFEKVDEKVRAQMFKLRQTWSEVFPAKKLYTLDIRVQCIDPAWPITAPAPTPSIHVNPRFFAKPNIPTPPIQTAITTTVKKIVAIPTAATTVPVPVDQVTLDMQSQVISKQKELLELRQKKLELELLQAKAKLEEQQKQIEKQTVHIIKGPQQFLLKPEVAKQLAQASALPAGKVEDTHTTISKNSSQALNIKLQHGVSSTGPRIAPVSSALVASVRPAIRDPRLAGKPTTSHQAAVPTTAPNTLSNYTNNSNIVENNYKVKNSTKTHNISNDIASTDSKLSTINKVGTQSGTLNRKDPRLHNKVQGPISSRGIKAADRTPFSSNSISSKGNTTTLTTSSLSTSIPNKSPVRKSNLKSNTSSRSFNKGGGKAGGGSGKQAGSKGTPTATSPTKYKKKSASEHGSPRTDKSDKRNSKSSSKSDKRSRDRSSGDKYDNEQDSVRVSPTVAPAAPIAAPSTPERAFKELKATTKNRNYMRRNRAISVSPEPNHDVDLRVGAPPEKQPRLQGMEDGPIKNPIIEDSPNNKDVDLRTLVVPAPVVKKRTSTENIEHSPAKKSKTEMFDVLFGNEDVDLRQLPLAQPITAPVEVITTTPVIVRPPTPPPPIISTTPAVTRTDNHESEVRKPKEVKQINSHFEALRAKLANATKMSVEESRVPEDTDMRLKPPLFSNDADVLTKIIISQADEQRIKTGNLSQALVEKVLTIFETQKLQEAQRRESENTNDFGNTTLTPISDDELSVDFSHSSDSEDGSKSSEKKKDSSKMLDRNNRIPPPAPVISQNAELSKDPSLTILNSLPDINDQNQGMGIDPRIPRMPIDHQNWHGHHRRRRLRSHWDSPPPGPEPWVRPPPVLNQPMYAPRRPFVGYVHPMDKFRMEIPPNVVEPPPREDSPPVMGSDNTRELPLADPLVLEYIQQDTMRTINIDGRPREIRYYEETAVVIMSWDDPREISFQHGDRTIFFDDKESFNLSFNDGYRDVSIGGNPHRIRLGAPTRELYIDGKWYECYFGGPGIGIEIDGKMRVVKMDGPPPHVKIGTAKRTDLVAGKINLIINARQMVPVFLDAKPQKFDIEGKIHTLRFVDALRTVLINEVPFKVEFGGLPKPITVHDKKHFIRFSVLPRGIKPGYVNISNMEGQKLSPSPSHDNENSNDATSDINNVPMNNEPALPMMGKRRSRNNDRDSPDSNRNSPVNNTGQFGSLDVLSSIMTSPMATSSNVNGYQIDMDTNAQDSQDSFPNITRPTNSNEIPGLSQESAPTAPLSFLPASLNINELFQKLVSTGIVTSVKETSPQPQKCDDIESGIKPVLFTQPETLKVRQPALVINLFSGLQCSSCGVRFPPENSMQYSQHLDWHFRQNRRGKNSARKALCRKWYYNVDDWKNFEEIEDIEEREKNWFESQQQQQLTEGAGEDGEDEIEIPSVPAETRQGERCDVCHDKFDQFYNEEKEEWHLRMAIRIEEKTYHPLCYDDYKASLVIAETSVCEPTPTPEVEGKKEEEESTKEEKTETVVKPEENETPEEKPKTEEDSEVKEEPKEETQEVEEERDESDDLQIVTEIIEEIIVDDGDDDIKLELVDGVIPGFENIVIKQEPVDDDVVDQLALQNIKNEPIDPDGEEHLPLATPLADNTQAELVSSIDGNVQLDAGMPSNAGGTGNKIKINITKPIIAIPVKEPESEPLPQAELQQPSDEPLPPGEEPIQLNLKPALQGIKLTRQASVMKGTELTGMCSIM